MAIQGWTSNSNVENHLIVAQGPSVNGIGPAIQDAINSMINLGNAQANMNYIVTVRFGGGTGNWTAEGTPVQLDPQP